MISKCKDITNKINELENRVNNFSRPKLSFPVGTERRPSTATYNSARANSRENIAQHMIGQIQRQINKERIEDLSSCPNMKCDAEKKSDASEIPAKGSNCIFPLKNPPTTAEKPFCECMMVNPFDEKISNMEEFTVMGMMNSFPDKWPITNSLHNGLSLLQISPMSDDEKNMDNFLIDSLRGEIEKVRHRLHEIGKRPCEYPQVDSYLSKQNTTDSPSGDQDYQSKLMIVIKDLQTRNDELSKQLANYKQTQENSLKKTEETAKLAKAYENKVKTLHEQTLKSSRIMANNKEKFWNMLRNRNDQIKNLFDINKQLKKNMAINEEQMNILNNNYKLLKENYKELEGRDKRNRQENDKFRATMRKLEEELKLLHRECSKLKEENIRFLQELKGTKQDIIRKYASRFSDHERHCNRVLLKTVESGAKLMGEVSDISENLQTQGKELENLRTQVKDEKTELQSKYEKLVYQYEALVRKFRDYEQFDEIKCSCIEQELKEFSMKMKEKESIILRERDELRTLVEELAKTIKKNKAEIRELNSTNQQQENVIDNLNEIIRVKDEQVLKYQKESKQFRMLYENSQHEINTLKRLMNEMEEKGRPEHENLEEELQNLREILNQERDNNLIKQKIIHDHEDTICNLKKQLNGNSINIENKIQSRIIRGEMERLSKDLEQKEIDLENEKKEKSLILSELEGIKSYKETLISHISDLENTVKSRCRDDEINQMDQNKTIDRLQKQLRQQKEEWEVQRKNLQKDKEKALHAAKFASQKLLDTVSDFQKQMCQQKAAQTKLAMLLQGKEQQLESLTMRVRSLLPSQEESNICLPSKSSLPRNTRTNSCQMKQLYPGSEQVYHSNGDVVGQESDVFSGESKSCSSCCD